MTDLFMPATGERRNLPLPDLVGLLQAEASRRLDVIAGSGALRSQNARLILDGTEPILGPDGVTMTTGVYDFNDVALGQVADKLQIPVSYLRRLHTEIPELFDQNVNGLLRRTDRRFLVRALRACEPDTGHHVPSVREFSAPTFTDPVAAGSASGGSSGLIRAFLSDRYHRIDNLDILLAALEGIRNSGAAVQIDGCDLSDRRMFVRVHAPGAAVQAPILCTATGPRSTASPVTGFPLSGPGSS
jgi:hypothetical protein